MFETIIIVEVNKNHAFSYDQSAYKQHHMIGSTSNVKKSDCPRSFNIRLEQYSKIT